MCASSPKHIHNLLSPGSGQLGSIINQIRLLQQLSSTVAALLPAPLGEHCYVAAVMDGRLILHADSAAWATRIRYLGPKLTASLKHQHGCQWLRDIHVKVRPAAASPGRDIPAPGPGRDVQPAPDPAAGKTAPDIQHALERLARHGPRR